MQWCIRQVDALFALLRKWCVGNEVALNEAGGTLMYVYLPI